MKSKERVTYPTGADQGLLKRFSKKALIERERCFNQEYETLRRQAKTFPKMGPNADAERAFADQRRLVQSLRREKPPRFAPLKGSNPARYAPFDWSSGFLDCGGQGAYDTCVLRGPNSATGQIGARLSNFASFADRSDALSAVSSVGFWYYALVTGTLYVTAQAYISGLAASTSGETYAGLQVSVEPFLSVGCAPHTTIDIFRSRVTGFSLNPLAQIVVNSLALFPSWEGRTVSILAPVRRLNWYLITVSAVQHVISGGTSDFDMHVGPVSAFLV